MKQYPYTIRCKQCGKEWHYEQFTCYMQKINAFHCNCGGILEVLENVTAEESPAEGVSAETEEATHPMQQIVK